MVKGRSSDPLKRAAQQIVGHEPRERVSHEALLNSQLALARGPCQLSRSAPGRSASYLHGLTFIRSCLGEPLKRNVSLLHITYAAVGQIRVY
jgi:hypothetical protein